MAPSPLVEMDDPALGRLVVGAGETVVLLGPSGSGKTALVRSLLGVSSPLPRPRSLRVRGGPVEDLAGVAGWVPDGDGVFLSESVSGNVDRDARRAVDALDLVGLAGRATDPVEALGRHGRRRVALARALALRRPLVVVDGELDPTMSALLPDVLAQLPWVESVLLAMATAGERAWRADTVVLMADGRVVAQAPLAHLVESPDPDVRGVLAWVAPA